MLHIPIKTSGGEFSFFVFFFLDMEGHHPDIKQVLYSEADIAKKVHELADRINKDYAHAKSLVLVGILKGSFMFLADLARRVTVPHRVEFMAVSSYSGTTSSGTVKIVMDLRQNVEGAHVIIVEDILDTGRTLHYLMELMRGRGPASVECCTLVRKPAMAKVDVPAKYVGFDCAPLWLVGYGLDYNEQYRTFPYIGELSQEAIEKGKEKK